MPPPLQPSAPSDCQSASLVGGSDFTRRPGSELQGGNTSPKDPVIATSPAYHDHLPHWLLLTFRTLPAAIAAGSPTGFWRMSGHPAVQQALRNHYFDSLGLPRIYVLLKPNPVKPPWYVTRMPGGVGGVAPGGVLLSRSMRNLAARMR
jgi:hypothetical protein